MSHAQKPHFVFRRNGRVHLNRQGRQFSRLLAAEVCASAVVMLDTPCSEVVWRVLATHSIRQFPLYFPSRASPCAIRFQTNSTSQTAEIRFISSQPRFYSFNFLPEMCFICSRPIQYTAHLPSHPSFCHLLLYCELVLRAVFRGTSTATFRVPQHTSLIMTSENVILITFNLFIFHGAGFIFTANRELQNFVFKTHAQTLYFFT
jgi:hypothetical protein